LKPEFAEKYYRIESAHPWSVGRRDILLRLIKQLAVPKDADVLEVGTGGGALIEDMVNDGFSSVVGIDMSDLAVGAARGRGLTQVHQGDATALEFDDDSFDVVIASDVLEHLVDERKALAEWSRVLRPGGQMLIFVPAFAFLWSQHDVENQHYRRYSRSMLESVLKQSGFGIDRIGYWNAWLFAPLTGIRMMQRVMGPKDQAPDEPKDQFLEMRGFAAKAFTTMFKLENAYLSAGGKFPVGVSVFAIARPK
jgi:ubiquinone/menaquinone biosynthesis C-methylase UbiE